MSKIDYKLLFSLATVVFVAGGAWWNLRSVSTDVASIKESLDSQESELTIHVSSDGHPSGEKRLDRIQTAHTEMRDDIRTMMVNQSAICQATNARCQ